MAEIIVLRRLKAGVWFNFIALGIITIMVLILLGFQTQQGSNLSKYIDVTGSNPIGIFTSIYTGVNGVLAILSTIGGGILALLGTVFFPNPYLTFAGIVAAMLPIGIGIGYDAFGIASGLIPPVIFGTLLSVFGGYVVNELIAWYKGSPSA